MGAWKSSSIAKTPTIFIVTNDKESLSTWAKFAKEKQYHIASEGSPQQGLQNAALLNPSLTILDLDLPHNETIELCRQFRAATHGAILLLIPHTTYTSDYYQAGVDEVMIKPINPMVAFIKSVAHLAREGWGLPQKETASINT